MVGSHRRAWRRLFGYVMVLTDDRRRVLFFPYGNHVEHASFYLEQAWEKEPPEDWYACVQFALILWNVNDPSIYVPHGTLSPSPVLFKFRSNVIAF